MRMTAITWLCFLAGAIVLPVDAAEPLAILQGADFMGGAQHQFGATQFGQSAVNYVYAQPTEDCAAMAASFSIESVPTSDAFVYLTARDDDFASVCEIEIALNGEVLLSGPSGFPDHRWRTRSFAIPEGVLRAGANELTLVNTCKEGNLGMPPWFMVAQCTIGDADYEAPELSAVGDLDVELPQELRPLPEPLPGGITEPGFAIRGTKGWGWTPQQYLEEIPILAEHKMNFVMNCYLSMFSDPEHWVNEWWKPIPAAKKRAFAEVMRSCREHGLIYCFAAHPQLGAPRRLDPTSMADTNLFWQHYAWAQREGVQWFNISLDDVDWGSKGPAVGGLEHAQFVNEILRRLRLRDPEAQFSFVPVPYWGDGTQPDHRAYLEALGAELDPDVYVFWTGDAVVTPTITRAAAESYKAIVKHRLILWDNYPVNDSALTVHLGPVTGRDLDLCEVIDGYMSNPMCAQNQMNRIPLLTCADYAYNPWMYDPSRSIGQAILHVAPSNVKSRVLADLVEAYPGMLIFGGGTGTNPVRERFQWLQGDPSAAGEADAYITHMAALASALHREFPGRFEATKRIVDADVAWMQEQ